MLHPRTKQQPRAFKRKADAHGKKSKAEKISLAMKCGWIRISVIGYYKGGAIVSD
jgi:hypothetical protein